MLYDYYKILEIKRTASLDEIKQAYRAKAKLVHPDVNDSLKAHELFLIVNEAYDVLSDDEKRSMHDIKLNYADKSKTDLITKKQSYNWAGHQPKTDHFYHKRSPIIYNLFFICGMFLGFLILFIALMGTINRIWPFPFIAIAIPGGILIVHGWKGIIGKKNLFSSFIRAFRKKSNNKTMR